MKTQNNVAETTPVAPVVSDPVAEAEARFEARLAAMAIKHAAELLKLSKVKVVSDGTRTRPGQVAIAILNNTGADRATLATIADNAYSALTGKPANTRESAFLVGHLVNAAKVWGLVSTNGDGKVNVVGKFVPIE